MAGGIGQTPDIRALAITASRYRHAQNALMQETPA